jgi:hypothetical protein
MNLAYPHEEVDIMFDEFTTLVSTVGFPIGISIYLLVRFEKKIEELSDSISNLTKVITAVMSNQKK